jgi:hypothetical protein
MEYRVPIPIACSLSNVDVRQRVPMLLLPLCDILVCQKVG